MKSTTAARPDTLPLGTALRGERIYVWLNEAEDIVAVTDSIITHVGGVRRGIERQAPYTLGGDGGSGLYGWTVPDGFDLGPTLIEFKQYDNGALVEIFDGVIEIVNPNLPPDTVPPVIPPDTVPPVPGGGPDSLTVNGDIPWVNCWWDGVPYSGAVIVAPDSSGSASSWYEYDVINDCHPYPGTILDVEVDITALTGWQFPPSGPPFFPRYCNSELPPPDTIALSTPTNLRISQNSVGGDHWLIDWDGIPEDSLCENPTGHPANCPDIRGDEVYYLVTEYEFWPDSLPVRFTTDVAMASTQRSFPWDYPGPGEVLPDSIRFCVLAEAWDCGNCIGPGGVTCTLWSTGDGQTCAAISKTACSDVLEVR